MAAVIGNTSLAALIVGSALTASIVSPELIPGSSSAVAATSQSNEQPPDVGANTSADQVLNPGEGLTTEPATTTPNQPVTSPAADPVTSPAADPVTSPAADPVTSPAADPVTSPGADPVTSPAAEPVLDPAAEPGSSPAAEPGTDPAAVPGTDPAAVPQTEPRPAGRVRDVYFHQRSARLAPRKPESCLSETPGLGGIFTITMSENHTNCFSHGGAWGDRDPVANGLSALLETHRSRYYRRTYPNVP